MKQQYIVDVRLQIVVESVEDSEGVANNVYLRLEVIPCPLPPITSSGSRDNGNTPAAQA